MTNDENEKLSPPEVGPGRVVFVAPEYREPKTQHPQKSHPLLSDEPLAFRYREQTPERK